MKTGILDLNESFKTEKRIQRRLKIIIRWAHLNWCLLYMLQIFREVWMLVINGETIVPCVNEPINTGL